MLVCANDFSSINGRFQINGFEMQMAITLVYYNHSANRERIKLHPIWYWCKSRCVVHMQTVHELWEMYLEYNETSYQLPSRKLRGHLWQMLESPLQNFWVIHGNMEIHTDLNDKMRKYFII